MNEKRIEEALGDYGYVLVERDMTRQIVISVAFMRHVMAQVASGALNGCSHVAMTINEAHPAFIDERNKVIQ